MTADELKAIRDRAKWLEPGHGMIEDPDVARRVTADVSALLAEVERLQGAVPHCYCDMDKEDGVHGACRCCGAANGEACRHGVP
jgi:hypothetical protein